MIQQYLAVQLSACLQSRSHIRNLQSQRIGVHSRVQSHAARHHSGSNVRRVVGMHSSVNPKLAILSRRREVQLRNTLRRKRVAQRRLHQL